MNNEIVKWQAWLEEIKAQVRSLQWSRQIYNETFEIIRANPSLPKQNSFYGAMQMWYAASILSGIRRQLKSSKQSISLVRLLEQIRDKPELLSRTRWRALHAGIPVPDSYIDQAFNRFAGSSESIDSRLVETDLASLKVIGLKCEAYSDKRVAHHDKGVEPEVPTYDDLDATLNAVDQLFQKYYQLVTASNALTEVSIAYNWKKVFAQPWIPLAP